MNCTINYRCMNNEFIGVAGTIKLIYLVWVVSHNYPFQLSVFCNQLFLCFGNKACLVVVVVFVVKPDKNGP